MQSFCGRTIQPYKYCQREAKHKWQHNTRRAYHGVVSPLPTLHTGINSQIPGDNNGITSKRQGQQRVRSLMCTCDCEKTIGYISIISLLVLWNHTISACNNCAYSRIRFHLHNSSAALYHLMGEKQNNKRWNVGPKHDKPTLITWIARHSCWHVRCAFGIFPRTAQTGTNCNEFCNYLVPMTWERTYFHQGTVDNWKQQKQCWLQTRSTLRMLSACLQWHGWNWRHTELPCPRTSAYNWAPTYNWAPVNCNTPWKQHTMIWMLWCKHTPTS